MKKTLLITYGFLLCLGLSLLAWVIPSFTPQPSGYGISPAALPNLLAGLIAALSTFLLTVTWYRPERYAEISPMNGRQALHLIKFAVVLFGAFPLMERVGFFGGSVIVLSLVQVLCGQRKIVPLLIVAVIVAGLVYAAVRYGLNVPLP